MSISSAGYAEYANRVKEDWIIVLEIAYKTKDWDEMNRAIEAIKKFYFSE